jgi:hypothetical protein
MADEKKVADVIREEHAPDHDEHKTPGTFALVILLMVCFALYYFANWKALSDVWQVR